MQYQFLFLQKYSFKHTHRFITHGYSYRIRDGNWDGKTRRFGYHPQIHAFVITNRPDPQSQEIGSFHQSCSSDNQNRLELRRCKNHDIKIRHKFIFGNYWNKVKRWWIPENQPQTPKENTRWFVDQQRHPMLQIRWSVGERLYDPNR